MTNARPPLRQGIDLVGWLLVTFAGAAVGAIASIHAADFYAQLHQPSWAPPAWLFGPVWSVLYLLMGVAGWLVWRSRGPRASALGLYIAQLVINAFWSWLFFAWHQGGLAVIDVLLLLTLILATMAAFWRASRVAAILLLPYLVWVAFASLLTWTLWRANPHLL